MSKVIALISVPLGAIIALGYFKIIEIVSVIPVDLVLVGALFLMLSQVFSFVMSAKSESHTHMTTLIRIVLALPGLIYVLDKLFEFVPFDMSIIVALFLFTEGLYGLH